MVVDVMVADLTTKSLVRPLLLQMFCRNTSILASIEKRKVWREDQDDYYKEGMCYSTMNRYIQEFRCHVRRLERPSVKY